MFLLFFLYFVPGYTQQPASGSSDFKKTSLNILARKVRFYWKGGSLTDALEKLAEDQEVKFSYAPGKLSQIHTEAYNANLVHLADLLDTLLKNTGFTYVVVGSTVVIVQEEKKESEMGSSPSDTMPRSTGKAPANPSAHVYPGSAVAGKLPFKERLRIYSIYRKELHLTAKYKIVRMGMGRDTLTPEEKKDPQFYLPLSYRYYLSASFGLNRYHLRYASDLGKDWKSGMALQTESKGSFHPEFTAGLTYRNFMVGAGIGFQSLTITGSWREVVKKVPVVSPPGNKDTFAYAFTDRYFIASVPVKALVYRERKGWFFAAGGGLRFDFVHPSKGDPYRFQRYFKDSINTGTFSAKDRRFRVAGLLEAQAGYRLREQMTLTAAVEYNYAMTPLASNSMYRLYANAFLFKVSFFYFPYNRKH